MGELVLAYDVLSSNKTSKPRAFYTRPNDGGTDHSLFKLLTKNMIITPRCKPIPMPDNVIEVVNQMAEDNGSPDGTVFCKIHKESTMEDMYRDIESQDNSSCASNKSWDIPKDSGEKY